MRRVILILWIIIFTFLSTACLETNKKPIPEKKPQKQNQENLISEPTISLFINETGEKKNIKIEEYLEGVVAAEMSTDWPSEALAAQAILARTFTMKKISEGGVKARGTDASTDVEEFQAYDPKKINSAVKNAVRSTRGKSVTYKGKYINAWFFADSGGKTASSAIEGLEFRKEKTPYIKSVVDPGSAQTTQENKAWKLEIPLAEVEKAVFKAAGKAPGKINTVSIISKGPSGRATSLKFNDTQISAAAFRLAVGSEKMRSTMLTSVFISGKKKLVVQGKGYGHGVGMSQWGAKVMAEKGSKADEIIKYFFKDITIKRFWK